MLDPHLVKVSKPSTIFSIFPMGLGIGVFVFALSVLSMFPNGFM